MGIGRRGFLQIALLAGTATALSGCLPKISLEEARQNKYLRQYHLNKFLGDLGHVVKNINYLGGNSSRHEATYATPLATTSLNSVIDQNAMLEDIIAQNTKKYFGEIHVFSSMYDDKVGNDYVIKSDIDVRSVLMHETYHLEHWLRSDDEVLRYYARTRLETDKFNDFVNYSELIAYFREVDFIYDDYENLISMPYLNDMVSKYLGYYDIFVIKTQQALPKQEKSYARQTIIDTFHPILHGTYLGNIPFITEQGGIPYFYDNISKYYIPLPLELKDTQQYHDQMYKNINPDMRQNAFLSTFL